MNSSMNENINPPLATPFIESLMMNDSFEEPRVTSSFARSVSRDGERERERERERESWLDSPFFPHLNLVATEVEDCVREYLEHISGKEGARKHQGCAGGDEDDSSVDTMSG